MDKELIIEYMRRESELKQQVAERKSDIFI